MGLTTIQDFVVDTLIEKQSITKEKLSNALDQILSSEGINKFLGLLIQEKPVDKKLNKGYGISLISIESDWNSKAKAIKFIRDKFGIGLKGAKDLVDATPVDLPFYMSEQLTNEVIDELTHIGVSCAKIYY